jgi:dephospho-CoA kinase
MSIIVGLTGGIGAGKSQVAKVFATLGIPIFDADAAAKKIMNTNKDLANQLIEHFGAATFKDGQLDKSFLASLVFADPAKLALLNSLVHPLTIQAAADWALTQSAPYVIKEAALFFESGSTVGVTKIIGISAPVSLRIHRVMQRDACTKQEVEKRMANQIEESLKMKLCDYVIVNDDQHLVLPQVISIHKQILAIL